MTKLDDLKTKMTQAVKVFTDTGDMGQIQAVNAELNKAKAEIAKTEGAKLVAEAEALAGKREALGNSVYDIIKNSAKPLPTDLSKQLAAVKAKGFTYTIAHRETAKGVIDPIGEVDVKGGVGLLVTAIKAHKAGTGGGAGKSRDEYGMSLSEIVDKFATAEELAVINGLEKGAKWQKQVAVKKQAIASGKLAPVK